jgi:hypothetical protein
MGVRCSWSGQAGRCVGPKRNALMRTLDIDGVAAFPGRRGLRTWSGRARQLVCLWGATMANIAAHAIDTSGPEVNAKHQLR